jgi:hypothetical protein
MRRAILLLVLIFVLMLAAVPVASAHVHGITPLIDCGKANANAGGDGTNGTPAAAANGGPIAGLIPRDTGNAPLTIGDGGFGATAGHCP